MNRFSLFLATVASALFLTSAAMAGDAESPTLLTSDWSGPYIGLSATHSNSKNSVRDVDELNDYDTVNDYNKFKLDTVQIGYNYQVDDLVFGLEVGVSHLDSSQLNDVFPGNVGGSVQPCDNQDLSRSPQVICAQHNISNLISLKPKLGYTFNRLMFYGFAGLAFGDVSNSVYEFDPNTCIGGLCRDQSPPHILNQGASRDGWIMSETYGIGMELAMSKNLSAMFEIQRYEFNSKALWVDYEGYDLNGGPYKFKFKNSMQSMRVGLNYHF